MKKKIYLFILSIIFLFFLLNMDSMKSAYTDRILSVKTETEEDILKSLEGYSNDLNTCGQLFLNKKNVPMDITTNTIYITQSLSKKSFTGRLNIENGELFFVKDSFFSEKKLSISDNHIFKLYVIQNGKYAVLNVIFCGMPIMTIDTNKENVSEVGVFDPYRENLQYQSALCNYEIRGGTSVEFDKKSYKLTLTNKKMSFLGMRKDDDWILNALYDDAGLIHNKLSYSVWQQIAESNLINIENSIDYNLFCMLICGTDNQRKNIYYVAEYQNAGTYKIKEIPYNLLKRWKQLRENELSYANIASILDENYAYLESSGTYSRNEKMAKWTRILG